MKAFTDEALVLYEDARWALVKMGEPAVEPLIQALQDEYWRVRMHAAGILGDIGDARAVEPLVQARQDEYRRVRYAAARALEKING